MILRIWNGCLWRNKGFFGNGGGVVLPEGQICEALYYVRGTSDCLMQAQLPTAVRSGAGLCGAIVPGRTEATTGTIGIFSEITGFCGNQIRVIRVIRCHS